MRETAAPDARSPAAVRVQFMGRPSDLFGPECGLDLTADGASLGDIRRRLADSLADGAGAVLLNPAIRGGVDDAVQPDSAWVRPGQTVFFFSVFSGG